MSQHFARVATCFLLLIASLPSLSAQQITGSITGTVKDEQDGIVTTALVEATNVDTGLSRAAHINNDGSYLIQYLAVGSYTVRVTAAGFKNFLQQNVVVTVDQILTLNVTLSVGAQTETVVVSDAPPLVNTSSAVLGRMVQREEIIGLPLVNRNAYTEISLTPGVQTNSASVSSNPAGTPNFVIGLPSTDVVINGGIDGGTPTVSFYLDGGINLTGQRNYGNSLPNPDALQEFRVETSNYSAEYGRMSGAVVTAVTRSGTNRFHGSLFEFVRNTAFNATPWNATVNAPYHRNQFGGAVGGPIKRDNAFFFFSYGGLRQSVGTFLSGGVVPTALERSGNFSSSKLLPVDPSSGKPYDYNGVPGWIPPSALDPTAANIISKYIPLPNSSNNAWTGFFTGPTTENEYLGKYDQVLSEKDHISVSYFNIHLRQNAYGSGNIPWSTNQSYAAQQNLNVSDVHTFSATTANQAWLTFTRVAGGRVNLPATSIGELGSNYTIQGPSALPELSLSGYFTAGGSLAGPVTGSDFYSIRDLVSMTHGKHSLDWGGEISLEHDPFLANNDNFGIFTFNTSAPGTTKNTLADFVTGKVATMEQDTPYHSLMSYWYFGFFLQDNYRLTQRLTLNLGLRYDIPTPPVESNNLIDVFKPGAESTVVPSAPPGLLFYGDHGVSRGIASIPWRHISPRVGLAWDPFGDGKTAVRAAGGVFYGAVSGNQWNQSANAQPFAVRQVFSSITSLTNVYGNPASFPNGDPFPYTYTRESPRFLPAASVETIAQNYQWPYAYQFNTAVERQLPGQMSVTAAYVGTLTHRTPFSRDENYPAWAPGASTSQSSINSRRPYDQGVLGQVWYIDSSQTASYHSLQISATKRFAHGFMVNGFYVLSKTFWSAYPSGAGLSQTQNYALPQEDRGPGDTDQRHTSSISGSWNLEYYRGDSKLVKNLANGWRLSAIATMNSGAPLNILTGANNNDDSYGYNRPNRVPGQNAFLSPHRTRRVAAAEWFNIAAFTPNGPGKGIGFGGADGNTPRDFLRAPGYRDIDLGLFRDIHFWEGVTLQLRAEATNAFNLVSLSAPTANLSSSLDGTITSAYTPRVMQLGMRLTF
jgi:Carboxypeptidase regulatory-like domain